MGRTKAEFKAIRETVGMPQSILAELLGVNIHSVKRWERPDIEGYAPPQDAWDVLDRAREKQRWVVDTAVGKAHEIEETLGRAPDAIDISYWHGSAEYESANPGEGRMYQMANADARLAAEKLESEGYHIRFGFKGVKQLADAES